MSGTIPNPFTRLSKTTLPSILSMERAKVGFFATICSAS